MPVPTIIANYAKTCLGKAKYTESNHYRGDELIPWVAEVPFGAQLPVAYTLTVVGTAPAVNAETFNLKAATNQSLLLQRDQVLYFPTPGVFAMVKTTSFVDDTAAGVAVPIRPLSATIPVNSTCQSYEIYPILSVMSGGFVPQTSGTIAESRNKGQSFYTAKAVFQRSATASGEGTAIRNDIGLAILENAASNADLVYIETRRPIYDSFGAGLNAFKYLAIVESSSPSSDASDFEKVNFSLAISGSPSRYTPLGMTLAQLQSEFPANVYLKQLNDEIC